MSRRTSTRPQAARCMTPVSYTHLDVYKRQDVILLRLAELDELVGGAPRTPAGIAACARELQRAGAKDILISLGLDGAVLVSAAGDALYLPEMCIRDSQSGCGSIL